MTFQQQFAIFLSVTVASDKGAESFVLLSLNWLFLALWRLWTLPTRTVSRVRLVVAKLSKWLTVYPFGGSKTVWAIG